VTQSAARLLSLPLVRPGPRSYVEFGGEQIGLAERLAAGAEGFLGPRQTDVIGEILTVNVDWVAIKSDGVDRLSGLSAEL
jgi:hypothetical protein